MHPQSLSRYKIVIEPSRGGATGTAYYNGGHYEDVYVKTPQGWRFGSRTVVTNREQAAKLTAADFDAIQLLAAANGGPYADVYEPIPGGTRFKSAGVAIEVETRGDCRKGLSPEQRRSLRGHLRKDALRLAVQVTRARPRGKGVRHRDSSIDPPSGSAR